MLMPFCEGVRSQCVSKQLDGRLEEATEFDFPTIHRPPYRMVQPGRVPDRALPHGLYNRRRQVISLSGRGMICDERSTRQSTNRWFRIGLEPEHIVIPCNSLIERCVVANSPTFHIA
jgi:hypothetical protein